MMEALLQLPFLQPSLPRAVVAAVLSTTMGETAGLVVAEAQIRAEHFTLPDQATPVVILQQKGMVVEQPKGRLVTVRLAVVEALVLLVVMRTEVATAAMAVQGVNGLQDLAPITAAAEVADPEMALLAALAALAVVETASRAILLQPGLCPSPAKQTRAGAEVLRVGMAQSPLAQAARA